MMTHPWSWGSLLRPDHEWWGGSSYAAASHGRWLVSWDTGSSCWCTSPCPSTRKPVIYPQPEPVRWVMFYYPQWDNADSIDTMTQDHAENSLPDHDFLHRLCISLHSACWSACGRYCPCSTPHPLTPSGSTQWQRGVIEKGYDRCVTERSIRALTDV